MKKTTKNEIVTVNNATVETNATVATNATKTNETINFETLYNQLIDCKTKCELVNVMLSHGLYTSTTPTTTPNVNDLYIQFNEKSRLLIGKKTLKVYTNDVHAIELAKTTGFIFDKVNDGSYRTKRATVQKTVDNFKTIFSYFEKINGFAIVQK